MVEAERPDVPPLEGMPDMATIEDLTAERDRALAAWSDMDSRVKRAQEDGTDYRLLPIMQGQARFLYAEYETLAARVRRRRLVDIVTEVAS